MDRLAHRVMAGPLVRLVPALRRPAPELRRLAPAKERWVRERRIQQRRKPELRRAAVQAKAPYAALSAL